MTISPSTTHPSGSASSSAVWRWGKYRSSGLRSRPGCGSRPGRPGTRSHESRPTSARTGSHLPPAA
jgi:hypothetical protein